MIRKAIAIDFDGCPCADAFPAIGEPNWAVIDRAKAEQRQRERQQREQRPMSGSCRRGSGILWTGGAGRKDERHK